MSRTIRVGMLGLGGVGSAVARALMDRGPRLELATGARVEIVRALVRDTSRVRELPKEKLTSDPAAITEASDIDVVVEVMGRITPARALVSAALCAGKPVVTANKELLATHGLELFALAAEKSVELKFEASVAAAIPILGRFATDLAGNEVTALAGII